MKIIEAAKDGNILSLNALIASGENILEQDEDGRSALHWAAINGHTELVKWLVQDKGLPIDLKDKEGRTAFFESCYEEKWGTASICLNLGANPNCYVEGTAPILMAAAFLQTELIREMLDIKDEYDKQKLDLTVSLKDGENALHMAASASTVHPQINLELVELLYDHGAPNCIDASNSTPAQYLTGCHDYHFGNEFEIYAKEHPHD